MAVRLCEQLRRIWTEVQYALICVFFLILPLSRSNTSLRTIQTEVGGVIIGTVVSVAES